MSLCMYPKGPYRLSVCLEYIYRDAETVRMSELRSCVKVEVDVLGSSP